MHMDKEIQAETIPEMNHCENLYIGEVIKILLGINEPQKESSKITMKANSIRLNSVATDETPTEPDIIIKARELKEKLDILWEEKGATK